MRVYRFDSFGVDHLKLDQADPPKPGPGEVVVDVKAASLNFRDLMVVKGMYNPKLPLPATPLSDGAGEVVAVGEGVDRLAVGDRVVSHFIAGWLDGPVQAAYRETTLGTPGPGLAAEQVALPAQAVLPIPGAYDFAEAATLPIAALTAWSVLRTAAHIDARQTVLTLGTGGVSIFALQLAKAMGARVIITSSSDEKLARCTRLGADFTVNYRKDEDWDRVVLELTDGVGADVTVENGGAQTLEKSMRATRPGGTIGVLGVLSGVQAELNIGLILMKRLTLAGIFVDSRATFEEMNAFLHQHRIPPIIDRRFAFDDLPDAFRFMEAGAHFGKIVIER